MPNTVTPEGTAEGVVLEQTPLSFVQRVRRHTGDRPGTSRITDQGGIEGDATSFTPPPAHLTRFDAGAVIEFEDGSAERCEVTGRDEDNERVEILRGVDGTEAASHAQNIRVLIEPRWQYQEIADAAQDILEVELWPYIWVHGETTLDYEFDGHYSPTVSGIESLVFAYQMSFGEKQEVEADFLSPEMVADEDFPNGMIVIPEHADTSTIYVAYRARPTWETMESSTQRLLALGTAGHLMMYEETKHAGPDADSATRTLRSGARGSAGALLWERFMRARELERIRLLDNEERERLA